jgi:hypothetical protein
MCRWLVCSGSAARIEALILGPQQVAVGLRDDPGLALAVRAIAAVVRAEHALA